MSPQLEARIQSALDEQTIAATAPTLSAVHARAGHLRNRRRALASAAALLLLAGASIAVIKRLDRHRPTVSVRPESTQKKAAEPGWKGPSDDVSGHGIISTDLPADLQPVTVRPWQYEYDPPPLGAESTPVSYTTVFRLADGRTLSLFALKSDNDPTEDAEVFAYNDSLSVTFRVPGWTISLKTSGTPIPFNTDELRAIFEESSTTNTLDGGRPALDIPGATIMYDERDQYGLRSERLASITWQAASSGRRRALSISTKDGAAAGYREALRINNPDVPIRATPIGDALMDDDGAEGNHITIAIGDAAVGERLVTVDATGLTADEIDGVLAGLRPSEANDIDSLADKAALHPLNHSLPVYRVDLHADPGPDPEFRADLIKEVPGLTAVGIDRYAKACATGSRELVGWIASATPGFIDTDDCVISAANFAVRMPEMQFSDGTSGPALLLAVASPGITNIPLEVKYPDGTLLGGLPQSPRFNPGSDGLDLFVLVGDIDEPGIQITMWDAQLPIVDSLGIAPEGAGILTPTSAAPTTEPTTSTAAAPAGGVASTSTSAATPTTAATTAASTTVGPSSTVTTAPTTTATTGAPTTEAVLTPSSIVVSTTAPAATATTG